MPKLHKITYNFLVIFSFICIFSSAFAQNGGNPFELIHRMDEMEIVEPIDSSSNELVPSTPKTEKNSTNPFDIIRSSNTVENEQEQIAEKTDIVQALDTKSKSKRSLVPQSLETPPFLFWIFTLTMLLLTILVTLYKSLIVKIYKGFLNDNFLKLIQRDQGNTTVIAYLSLYILFFTSLGTLFYLCLQHFGLVVPNLTYLLYCILGVAVVFIFKHSILSIAGFVFPIDKVIKQYSFTIVVFSIILGLVLLPFNIFIAYAQTNLATYLIYLAFLIIILVYLFRTLRGALIASKYISLNKFHFFMYLCTVEIAPLLVLFKSISSLSGI